MDSTTTERQIKIMVSKGVPYIWTVEDWYTLRVDHRIVGNFDGAAPPWDIPNRFPTLSFMQMNLPLRLSSEEALYLVKHDIAKAYEVPEMNELKPPVNVERYQSVLTNLQEIQLEKYKLKRKAEIESKVDQIIEGRRKKGRETSEREVIINEELSKFKMKPAQFTTVQLKDPWTPEDQKYVPFDFPVHKTILEKVRFMVFDDFTFNRKYYVTNGMKFGGDFLAYPGDPMHHHAEFIIVCEDDNKKVHTSHLIAHARLASIVKKTFLIAFIDAADILKYKPVTVPYLNVNQPDECDAEPDTMNVSNDIT